MRLARELLFAAVQVGLSALFTAAGAIMWSPVAGFAFNAGWVLSRSRRQSEGEAGCNLIPAWRVKWREWIDVAVGIGTGLAVLRVLSGH